MTAIICAMLPDRALVMTDAAMYTADHIVAGFAPKVHACAAWPGILINTGALIAGPIALGALAMRFQCWDDLIRGAESVLPAVMAEVAEYRCISEGNMVLVGVSAERGPEAWSFNARGPYQLFKLPDIVMTPAPESEVIVADYQGFDPAKDDPEMVAWSMQKILEMQRQMFVPADAPIVPMKRSPPISDEVMRILMEKRRQTKLPEDIGAIGGYGELTTVHRDGRIERRIVCRWDEDSVSGGPLRPWPLDWAQWHRENPRPKPAKKLRIVR